MNTPHLVDNNYYTNRMAKENMAFAAWLTGKAGLY
jgi:trehalose/maltose hydrolase-like predicted phosphorylase